MEIIENGAVTAAEEQVAEAGDQQEMMEGSVVSLSQILSDAQDSNAENPDAGEPEAAGETVVNESDDGSAQPAEEPASAPQPQTVYRTQAEFDAAFTKRMANERNRNRPFVEMGQAVMDVAGDELTNDEVKAAISHALAEKRSRANNTDYDTEINNIRVEQRVAQRFAPRREVSDAPQPAENPDARARQMLEAMSAIGDDAFTVAALQGNQEAMVAWANGATPAEVYRRYFAGSPTKPTQTAAPARAKRPAPERTANSGPMGVPQRKLTAADIKKIDAAIAEGGGVSLY